MDIRQAPIDPHCWYVVARSTELVSDRPLGVRLWQQSIALYRRADGTAIAIEDRCPHRQIKLSQGKVRGDRLECPYHGWQFEASGQCARVPYLQAGKNLPACRLRTYPVREQDGFIWLFPGEAARAQRIPLLGLPEWNDLNCIASVATIECQAHFSFLIENLMDACRGHLHPAGRVWSAASLKEIRETDDRVDADYSTQSYYRLETLRSVLSLFLPGLRRWQAAPLQIGYRYPHWQLSLGQDLRIYCLLCPVGPQQTRAYLVQFASLKSFWQLHPLPVWFRRGLKRVLCEAGNRLLADLVCRNVATIEQEQQAYLENPYRHSYDLDQTVASVQRVIRFQALAASRRPTQPSTAATDVLTLASEARARIAAASYRTVPYRSDRANSRSK